MEEKKENRGGIRNGSGRKPLSIGDKKVQIKFWVENKYIFPFGGVEKAAGFALETIKNGNNPVMERLSVQNLNEPTNQIKPITEQKPLTNTVINTIPVQPLISPYNGFRIELKDAKTIKEIEKIMERVKAEAMIPQEKLALEAYAKEVSKDMYTD